MKKIFIIIICNILLIGTGFAQWKQTNGPYGGYIQTLSLDTATNYLYAGTLGNGVLRSTDNGSKWTSVKNGLSSNGLWVNSIAISGSNIYAGTNGGIYSSVDNGDSWIAISTGLSKTQVNSIAVDGNNILVATNYGVYVSSINDSSWTAVNTGLSNTNVSSLAINGSNIFAGTNGGGVYLSTNNGGSWTAVNTGLLYMDVLSLAISGSNIFAGTYTGGVFLSTDTGSTWTAVNNGLSGNALWVTSLAIDGYNIFAGTFWGGVYTSADNGKNWTEIYSGMPNTIFNSIITSGSNILTGTDNGIYLSANNGNTWTAMNTGISNAVVNFLVISESNIYAGTNNGVFLSADSGNSWTEMNNGLSGKYVYSLAIKDNNIFAGTDGGIFLSTNNGSNWTAMNNGLSGIGLCVTSIAIAGEQIFAGMAFDGVYVSDDNGKSWKSAKLMGIGGDSMSVLSLVVSGNNILAGTLNWGVFRLGNIWENKGLVNTLVNCLVISGSNIYAGTNYGVYLSTDNGDSWTAVSSGLLNTYVYSLITSGGDIFAGTDGGVYLSTDSGSSWALVNQGLTAKDVYSLVIKDNNIYAGTYNAGIWERSLSDFNIFSISRDTLPVAAKENSINSFNIITYRSWTAISDQTWLTISNTIGSGNATITLTAEANPTTSKRTAVVTVSGTGAFQHSITVIQNGATPVLTLSTDSLTIPSQADSTRTFNITSNTDWKATSSQTWLTINKIAGFGNDTITLTSEANPTNASRKATIKVSGTGVSPKSVIVTQQALKTGLGEIETNSISFNPNPANSVLYFRGITQNTIVSVYDLQGKLILNKDLKENQIDISDLTNGIYLIIFDTTKGILVRKFIKQ